MFENTKNSIKELGKKLKATGLIFQIIGQLFPIGYLIFLIIEDIGSKKANHIFLGLSILYLALFLFMELRDFNKNAKKVVRKFMHHLYRWGTHIIRLLLIIVPSYGLVVTIRDFSPLALVLLLLTILGMVWEIVWNILVFIVKRIFRRKTENFINSFKRDFPNLYPRQYDDQQDFSAYGDIHEEN